MTADPKFKTISNALHEHLSMLIIEGELAPGQKLTERELSDRFGVSRSPIRECLRVLEAEGLVVIHPRRGASVKKISAKNISEVFPVRANLESLAGRLACEHMTKQNIENLKSYVRRMDEAIIESNVSAFTKFNYRFHSEFIRASQNDYLGKTLRDLGRGLWLRVANLYFQSQGVMHDSNRVHEKIIGGFEKRDVALVQILIARHIDAARQNLLQSFR